VTSPFGFCVLFFFTPQNKRPQSTFVSCVSQVHVFVRSASVVSSKIRFLSSWLVSFNSHPHLLVLFFFFFPFSLSPSSMYSWPTYTKHIKIFPFFFLLPPLPPSFLGLRSALLHTTCLLVSPVSVCHDSSPSSVSRVVSVLVLVSSVTSPSCE